jgi:hypothetical protein
MQSASAAAAARPQSSRQALIEAFGHGSYVLLVLGFFTCGFQLAFVTVHLLSYLVDRGLAADIGAWTIGLIGLFNIIGSLSAAGSPAGCPGGFCFRSLTSAARRRSSA